MIKNGYNVVELLQNGALIHEAEGTSVDQDNNEFKPEIVHRNLLQGLIYCTSGTSINFGSHQYTTLLPSQNPEGAPDAQQLRPFATISIDESGLIRVIW